MSSKADPATPAPALTDEAATMVAAAEELVKWAATQKVKGLDFSVDSLGRLDELLERLARSKDPITIKTRLGCAAYLGEVMVRRLGGTWGAGEHYGEVLPPGTDAGGGEEVEGLARPTEMVERRLATRAALKDQVLELEKAWAPAEPAAERAEEEPASEESTPTPEQIEAAAKAAEEREAAKRAAAEGAPAESGPTPEQIEAAAKAAEEAEAERLEADRKGEAERLEAEKKAEAERLEAEKKAEAEKAEAERLAAEKAEAERLEAEKKAEAERLEAEKKAEAEKAEAERLAAEKAEAERLEAEKKAEAEKAEAERLAAEKAEAERMAAEKAEAERLEEEKKAEAERLEAEKAEAERLEAEKKAAAMMQQAAEAFVGPAKANGAAWLDYSPASVMLLDELVSAWWAPTPEKGTYESMIPAMGAYVGEVLVREAGGRWIRDPGEGYAIDLNGRVVFPMKQIAGRFELGASQSIGRFYSEASGGAPAAAEAPQPEKGKKRRFFLRRG